MTTTTAHPFPLPPCLTAAGVALVTGTPPTPGPPPPPPSPAPLPPGLHAWAEARRSSTSSRAAAAACPPAALDAHWRQAIAALVVGAFNHPVAGVLTPVRLPGDGGGRVLLARSTTGALSVPAVAAWRQAAEAAAGAGGVLPDLQALLPAVHAAAWAGLGVALERRPSGAVAATFSWHVLGGAAVPPPRPTPPPLPTGTCPTWSGPPPMVQRLLNAATPSPVLEVEAVVERRACLLLQAPFPFRLGRPTLAPCAASGELPSRLALWSPVRYRRTVDAPDTAVICLAPGESREKRTCVRASAPLTPLPLPLVGASVGLVTDRHARVPVPPAVLVANEGGTGLNSTALTHYPLLSFPPSILLATSLDPAGARPAVVDETAADLVLCLTSVVWAVLAAALLQASAGVRRGRVKMKE